MSEVLFRKSWEPLSEADNTEPQLIQFFDSLGAAPTCPEVAVCDFGDGVWRYAIGRRKIQNVEDYKFLCLTPVTPEDKG